MVSIVSFNIDSLSFNRSINYRWEIRKNKVLQMIKKTAPDVLGLQEACRENIEVLRQCYPQSNVYIGHEVENEDGCLLCNPIFWNSNLLMLKCGCFYLSDDPENADIAWDAWTTRMVSWVLLYGKKEPFRLLIANTHLDHKGVVSRRKASTQIINFLCDMMEKECCNILLLGDFNSRAWFPRGEDQRSYGELIFPGCIPSDEIMNMYKRAGFKDAYLMAGNRDCLQSNTYNDYFGEYFPDVGLRIDWQLIGKYNNKITLHEYSLYKKEIISDHYPVICIYNISPSLEDCLYLGRNRSFQMCDSGYALREIAEKIRNRFSDEKDYLKFVLYHYYH